MTDAFRAAFFSNAAPSAKAVDQVLVGELRKTFDIPVLTLDCAPCSKTRNVRRSVLRVDLEVAVLQLPPTEKLIFLMHDLKVMTTTALRAC